MYCDVSTKRRVKRMVYNCSVSCAAVTSSGYTTPASVISLISQVLSRRSRVRSHGTADESSPAASSAATHVQSSRSDAPASSRHSFGTTSRIRCSIKPSCKDSASDSSIDDRRSRIFRGCRHNVVHTVRSQMSSIDEHYDTSSTRSIPAPLSHVLNSSFGVGS